MQKYFEHYVRLGSGYYDERDNSGPYAIDSSGAATLMVGGTGGGGALTEEQFLAVTGSANAAMWDGIDPNAELISILKAIHEQNEALKRIGNETNTLLVQVAEHTRQTALNTDTTV